MKITELIKLKKLKEKSWKEYKTSFDKLVENCHCPDTRKVTKCGYETDTLGSNGSTYYMDHCSLCRKSHGSYGGVYSSHQGGPNFKVVKDI